MAYYLNHRSNNMRAKRSYYHDLITQKSWQVLQDLRRNYDFILIGGWAVFLYTHALKSKDIDLVCDFEELEKFKEKFEVVKNDRLKKYEARSEEVEIDIYIPYYSNCGLPAEELEAFTNSLEAFKVVEKEVLAILKGKALISRSGSAKGKKDLIDLVSLFKLDDFNFRKYKKLVMRFNLADYIKFTHDAILDVNAIDELSLNVHKMSKLKKRILPLLS